MADAKHTPGPWRVSPEHPTIIRRDFRPISDEGELIGSAAGYDNSGYFPSDAEAVANARLIAAAPELLAACEAAIFMLKAIGRASGGTYDALCFSVRKATGEKA